MPSSSSVFGFMTQQIALNPWQNVIKGKSSSTRQCLLLSTARAKRWLLSFLATMTPSSLGAETAVSLLACWRCRRCCFLSVTGT
ncbi:hypothetical protein D3C71_1006560 [compost metagenome]